MFEGLQYFFCLVKTLRKIRVDFEETQIMFTTKNEMFNIGYGGLFAPYDPNYNVLEGATKKFFKVFKKAAYRSTWMINKNKYRRMQQIYQVFKPSPTLSRALNFGKIEIIASKCLDDPKSNFPSVWFNESFHENGDKSRTTYKRSCIEILLPERCQGYDILRSWS